MKKLFAFCLLASFTLATNSFAGVHPVTDDNGGEFSNNHCSPTYNLHACPTHATCKVCHEGIVNIEGAALITKYQMTGCESGYTKVGNKCVKNITREATPTKIVPTTSTTQTVTTKKKK